MSSWPGRPTKVCDWRTAAGVVALLLTPVVVFADAGDVALGGYVGARSTPGAEASVRVQHGLTDWLAARGSVGGGAGRHGIGGELSVGVAALLDVWTWVPAVTVETGLRLSDTGRVTPHLAARLEVRRYLTLDWSVGLSGGVILPLVSRSGDSPSEGSALTGLLGMACWRDL